MEDLRRCQALVGENHCLSLNHPPLGMLLDSFITVYIWVRQLDFNYFKWRIFPSEETLSSRKRRLYLQRSGRMGAKGWNHQLSHVAAWFKRKILGVFFWQGEVPERRDTAPPMCTFPLGCSDPRKSCLPAHRRMGPAPLNAKELWSVIPFEISVPSETRIIRERWNIWYAGVSVLQNRTAQNFPKLKMILLCRITLYNLYLIPPISLTAEGTVSLV